MVRVSGSPPLPGRAHPTLLKALVVTRRWRTHAAFVREYARAAAQVDESLVRSAPGREQYERWLAGRVKTMPYPHHFQVLEAMFPGHRAEELFAPPPDQPPPIRPPGQADTQRVSSRPELEEEDDMRRRDVLHLLGGTAALGLLSDFGESTRQGLERLLATGVGERDLDEWERTVDLYGVEIGAAAPTVMLQHLLTDIAEVHTLLAGRTPLPAQRRLLRVAAQLSVLTAVTIIATGAPQAGRRWWRTARRMAEQVGDAELEAFVAGQQAILAMYCGYSHEQVIELADTAISPSGRDLICTGAASATAARAQALSALGRPDDAGRALDRLRFLLDRLPDQVTAPTATWFAYPEYKLRHVESYVNTRLGRTRQAAAAQDAAVAVYPASKYRGLSQVQLHRAACMIMDGFVEEGITHATTILQGLPTDLRHDALVSNVAHAALTAVPVKARALTPVADYRHLLAAGGVQGA